MSIAVCFDIDGTLTSENVWRGLMAYFRRRGLRRATHLFFMGLHYPLYLGKRLRLVGEGFFRRNWAAHLAWYVRGYTPEQAETVWDWVVTDFLPPYWRADVRALLEAHRDRGHVVALVSAAPQPLVARIARFLGAHYAAGTRFERRRGAFSGRALPPVCLGAGKVQRIRRTLADAGVPVDWQASWAYADSETDVPLLESVGHPVAVYPDERLLQTARRRGWTVLNGDSAAKGGAAP